MTALAERRRGGDRVKTRAYSTLSNLARHVPEFADGAPIAARADCRQFAVEPRVRQFRLTHAVRTRQKDLAPAHLELVRRRAIGIQRRDPRRVWLGLQKHDMQPRLG